MNRPQKQEILEEFSKQIIFYPGFQLAYSQLQKSVEATALRHTPSCAFVMGRTGAGKTTLCELFRDSFGPVLDIVENDGIYKKIPALYILPSAAPVTIKGFCLALLEKLGNTPPRLSVQELTQMLVRQLKTTGVELLIFDEIQRLMRADAEKTRESTLDWIVALLSLSNIPIVLCGDETCEKLLDSESTKNSPFARRYCYTATLDYFAFEEGADSAYIMTLLELDKKMYQLTSLQGDVHLHEPAISIPLFIASLGILEFIRQVIHEALNICLSRPSSTLRLSDFADACRCLRLPKNLAGKNNNPFNLSTIQCLNLIDKHYEDASNG